MKGLHCLGNREEPGLEKEEPGLRRRRSLASLRRPEEKEELVLALEGSEDSRGAWPHFRRTSLASLRRPEEKEELVAGRRRALPCFGIRGHETHGHVIWYFVHLAPKTR